VDVEQAVDNAAAVIRKPAASRGKEKRIETSGGGTTRANDARVRWECQTRAEPTEAPRVSEAQRYATILTVSLAARRRCPAGTVDDREHNRVSDRGE
jgi:hypothetical protein